MASTEDPAADPAAAAHIFNEDEDLLDDDDDDSSDRDEDDSASSAAAAVDLPPTTFSAAALVTVAVPGVPDPHLKQQLADTVVAKKPAQLDDSRKLFQRLWTDGDEIELLQGFLDYTTQRGGPHSSFNHHHHDTTAFYDQIRDKFQLDFNKNQLVEKLRRLKKKYRNVVNKFGSGKDYAFKSPHDHATFEISSKIWGTSVLNGSTSAILAISAPAPLSMYEDEDDPGYPNFAYCQSPNPNGIDVNSKTPRPRKRNRTGAVKLEDKQQPVFNSNTSYNQPSAAPTPIASTPVAAAGTTQSVSSVIEETVKSCLSPILKELLGNSTSSNVNPNGPFCVHGFASTLSPMPLGFAGAMNGAKMADEKWRKQQILELEVFSKRLELMQDQIKEQLLELRTMGK
ncbi:probable transcription factor At3g04930 [Primulina eburnea]|uniref:probable transcription factor At3g04930 n=1 Tax=Primulina eburnea TaxID=1245227 RepID=UPI003C6C6A85